MISQVLRNFERRIALFWAVVRREALTRFGIRSLSWIEEAGTILVHVIAFTAVKLFLGSPNHRGMEVLPFTAIGVMTYWVIRTGMMYVAMAPNSMIRYSEFPQVTLLHVAFARGVVNFLLCFASLFATFYALQLMGYSRPIRDTFMVVYWYTLAGLLGIACGFFFMWPFYMFPFVRTVITTLLMRIVAVVSGAFFVYQDLPYFIRPIAQWFPPLHINDKIREAYFYTFHAGWASQEFVVMATIIIFAIGLLGCDLTRRQLRTK
jgi:ABC-type polysaccharide/polyol phosphate export permease